MQRDRQDGGIVVERPLRAVAVMHIPVDDSDPLQSESVPRDLWHLRGHLYVARRRVTDPSGRHHFNFAEPELSTVNLFDCTECKGLEAATQYLDAPFNLPDLAD